MSWTTLNVLLGGVTIVGGTGIYFKNEVESNQFYKSRVIVQAIDVAKQNNDLKTVLGEPIKGGKVNAKDEKNFMNDQNAHFEIPLYGKVHNAVMLVDAIKDSPDTDWELDQVHIQFRGKEHIIAKINIFKRNEVESSDSKL